VIKTPKFPRVHEYAGAWLLEQSAARVLLQMAERTDWRQHVAEAGQVRPKSGLETVTVTSADPMQPQQQNQQFAVVRLSGLLMKQESSMMDSTSTVMARRDIRTAAQSPNIGGIMLVIDSPGGSAAGTDDLYQEISAAAEQKPVVAFIEDLGASAAFYAACGATEIYANNPGAWVGSIGTVMTIYDVSKQATDNGVEAVVFATGDLKGAGTPGAPLTQDQRDYFQGLIDNTQKLFDAAVSTGRELNAKQLAAVRTGQVWPAAQAAGLGLIDGILPYDDACNRLVQLMNSTPNSTQGDVGMTFEQWVKQNGVDLSTATPDAKAGMQLAFELNQNMAANGSRFASQTVTQPLQNANVDVTGSRAAAANEIRRQAAISAAGAKYRVPAEKTAQAIESGMDAKEFELEALRSAYAGNRIAPIPEGSRPSGDQRAAIDGEILQAAILQAGGYKTKKLEKQFSNEVLERAHTEFRSGISLQEILLTTARANGYRGRMSISSGNLREVLQSAFSPMMDGGVSTYSLSGILSNIANKFLLEGYQSGDDGWRQISKIRSVSDLKTTTSYRWVGGMKFEKVGPTGAIPHGKASEQPFTNQASTFAKMFAVTRTDIINDNLGALTSAPSELGRGGIDSLNEAFWTTFMNNGSFFSTSAVTTDMQQINPNKQTASPLGVAGLTAAKALFMKQIKPDGTPLNIMPYAAVVPAELLDPLTVLLRDREIRDNTANKQYVTGNPHAGSNLVPVASPFLSNSNISGNSAVDWYLTADPAQCAAIEVVFLNGQQSPVIESSDLEFDTLGIQFRGYFDFGVNLQDKRGAVKSVGT
jgi:signal peptide peptidase SppA